MPKINVKFSDRWLYNDSLYLNTSIYDIKSVLRHFQGYSNNPTGVLQQLKQLPGFFAIVYHSGNTLWAATDRVRSVPLFYANRGNDFYLSDNVYWIAAQLDDNSWRQDSQLEFLMAGFVTGRDTLHPSIMQLQAGELLYIDNCTHHRLVPATVRYFEYIHEDTELTDDKALLNLWEDALLSVFERFINLTRGRRLVLPLSGGYDSRLIAMMLYRLGYKNVLCYSYGVPGNHESVISQIVAKRLDFEWRFIPYSKQSWESWHGSSMFDDYVKYADGLCSVAHIQDWPAIWEMVQNDLLDENCIFVPGHSADFLAGSHIPGLVRHSKTMSRQMVNNLIIRHHFSLWDVKRVCEATIGTVGYDSPQAIYRKLVNKLDVTLHNLEIHSVEQAVSALEYWDWQERQSKFIVNSVRAYEFWGYDYYLPFWELEIVDFWRKVPLGHRIGKKLYNMYIHKLHKELGLTTIDDETHATGVFKQLFYRNVSKAITHGVFSQRLIYGLIQAFQKTKRARHFRTIYDNHPLAWYGVIPFDTFKTVSMYMENINSVLAAERLGLSEQFFNLSL